jgi:Ser/Thr protein kinase RdoA (MazF antagonist)
MGRYQAPFVHGKMAKLGSDVDILVEMEAAHEADVPGTWHLFNPEASNHCAVYHIAEIPLVGGMGEWASRHSHIPFTQHLIDAYIFFPSHGHEGAKDAFLKKFGAKLVYDRSTDGIVYRSDEEQRIAARLAEIYGFGQVAVERMKVSTENALYKVFLDHRDMILKLFKVSGNYQRTRVAEHTDYEERLIGELRTRGIRTPGVIQAERNRDTTIEGCPALLFERLQGIVQQRPEYDLGSICEALAAIHHVQMVGPLDVPQAFTFDEYCMLWLPVFQSYLHNPAHSPEVAQAFASMAPVAERCNPGDNRALWYAHSPAVHCHGDVTPKNVIVGADGQASFFDFNNAFYGPRLADVVDGGIEFSLAEKYVHLADFGRFDAFVESYSKHNPLTSEETEDLPHWIELVGLIKFTKEIRVLLERPKEDLRRKRALAIAAFVTFRCGSA